MLEAARTADVMTETDLAPLSGELEGVVAMDAVFDQRWVSRIEGVRVKTQTNKMEQAQALIDDIERFRVENDCDRLVMVSARRPRPIRRRRRSTTRSSRSSRACATVTTTSPRARSTRTPR